MNTILKEERVINFKDLLITFIIFWIIINSFFVILLLILRNLNLVGIMIWSLGLIITNLINFLGSINMSKEWEKVLKENVLISNNMEK